VTAKRRETLRLGFEHVPELGEFDVIVTSDETAHHKPHPEPILLALERLGAAPGDAAYVGDSPFDVGSARAAGVFAVAPQARARGGAAVASTCADPLAHLHRLA